MTTTDMLWYGRYWSEPCSSNRLSWLFVIPSSGANRVELPFRDVHSTVWKEICCAFHQPYVEHVAGCGNAKI